jgi:hypothetical protein
MGRMIGRPVERELEREKIAQDPSPPWVLSRHPVLLLSARLLLLFAL